MNLGYLRSIKEQMKQDPQGTHLALLQSIKDTYRFVGFSSSYINTKVKPVFFKIPIYNPIK